MLFANKSLKRIVSCGALAVGVAVLTFGNADADENQSKEATPAPANFDDHAKTVFRQHCVTCHNANKKSGDLDLSNYGSLMLGGSSGNVIEPGSADESYLLQLVTHEESPEMPPDGGKIPDADIKILRNWIEAGALKNSASKVKKRKKNTSLEMAKPSAGRPEQVAMPEGLSTESTLETVRPPMAKSMASSPWAPVIAVAAANQVLLYHADVEEEQPLLGVLPWPEGQPQVVIFSRDGSVLLGAGGRAAASGFVILWDVKSGEQLLRIGDELDSVLAADLNPTRDRIATGGPERAVRIYDMDSDAPLYEIRDHTDWVTAVAYSPDGNFLATGDRNGGVTLREANSGEVVFRLTGHKAAVTGLSWRLDSKLVASASESGKVTLWETGKGKATKTFDANPRGCQSVTFTRDGQLLTTGRDKKVALWTIKGKSIRNFKGLGGIGVSAVFNDETQIVFAGSFSGRLLSWNADQQKSVGKLSTNPSRK